MTQALIQLTGRRAMMVTLAGVLAIALWGTASGGSQDVRDGLTDYEITPPCVAFDAAAPPDAARQQTSRRWDGRDDVASTGHGSSDVVSQHGGYLGVDSLPIEQSDVIVEGTVVEARAYLSNDRRAVYSEYTVRVEEFLKPEDRAQELPAHVVAERPGGTVKYANGAVTRYLYSSMGVPKMGRRYVLFLIRIEDSDRYALATGYVLKTSGVLPLDPAAGRIEDCSSFASMEPGAFLRLVRDRIARSPRSRISPP